MGNYVFSKQNDTFVAHVNPVGSKMYISGISRDGNREKRFEPSTQQSITLRETKHLPGSYMQRGGGILNIPLAFPGFADSETERSEGRLAIKRPH